jgi:hypothetical protein
VRLLEYAPDREIIRLLGFAGVGQGWPAWRGRIRSESRKQGFDFGWNDCLNIIPNCSTENHQSPISCFHNALRDRSHYDTIEATVQAGFVGRDHGYV